MNVLFKIGGTVITPALTGSVLPGITRKSCIELLKSWGVPVEERLITAEELFDAAEAGRLEEAFGSGTAAVISPVGELRYEDEVLTVVSPIGEMGWGERHVTVNGGQIGALTRKLYDTLTGIQWGTVSDPFGWTLKL